jgi:hypothetical protein
MTSTDGTSTDGTSTESPTVAPAGPDAVSLPRPRRPLETADPERARLSRHPAEYWDLAEACWRRCR